MAEASKTLTPVVLELGGKDPFVVLPGADVESLVHVAARGGWGAGGQNCIGAERFFVHTSLVQEFTTALRAIASTMRQGPPLHADGHAGVDIGAMCLPGEVERIRALVDDARTFGATVVCGGTPVLPPGTATATTTGTGQFFPPTLVVVPDLTRQPAASQMKLLQQEVFGPLITVIPFSTTEELVRMVNGNAFALGSSVFGPSDREVAKVGKQLQAGMLAANDFATCYMCQSLPMGGLKDSGFGKFAGVEGLRGLCMTKAVVEDRFPFIRTDLPPPLRYPLDDVAFPFVVGLMHFFYGHSLRSKLLGVITLIRCSLSAGRKEDAQLAPGAARTAGEEASVPEVVHTFNTARLQGDVAASSACCTSDVCATASN